MFKLFRLMATTLLLAATAAHAQLTVEITGAGANRIPIAIANFAGEGLLPQALVGVVRADLERSGLFKLVDPGSTPVHQDAAVDLNQWKERGADALALASILPVPGGRYEVRMRLYDIARQNKPDGMIFLFGAGSPMEQLIPNVNIRRVLSGFLFKTLSSVSEYFLRICGGNGCQLFSSGIDIDVGIH